MKLKHITMDSKIEYRHLHFFIEIEKFNKLAEILFKNRMSTSEFVRKLICDFIISSKKDSITVKPFKIINIMPRLSFILDEKRFLKLKAISRKKKKSVNSIIREIINDFLREKTNSQTNDSSSGSDDSSL